MGKIRTIQYTGSNCIEVLSFLGNLAGARCSEVATTDRPVVHTPEGELVMCAGDWVLQDAEGRFHVLAAAVAMAHTTTAMSLSTPPPTQHP